MAGNKQAFAPQVRSFDLNRASINEDARTVDVVFSTETDQVERWFGREILDHGPKSVRLQRLANSAPLLLEHNSREQIGVIESAAIAGKQGTATVRFSKSEKAQEIFEDIKDGIRSKVSVGYRVHNLQLERSDKQTGVDTYRVTDWEPFEISIVSIPADDSAGVRGESTDSIFGQRAAELTTYIAMSKPEDNQEDRAADTENKPSVPAATTPETPETGNRAADNAKLSEAEIEARANALAGEKTRAELTRIDEIRSVGNLAGIPAEEIKKAERSGESVADFKARTFDILAAKNPPISTPRGMDTNENQPEKGSRAAMLASFEQAAKAPLAARGIQIIARDYSKEREIERKYLDSSSERFHRSMSGAVTLIDVAKLDAGIGSPLISEVAVVAPEARVFPVDVIQGGTVELSVNTAAATVGFRNANEGTTPSIGTFESRIFQTQVIEHPIVIDIQGVLQASKDPARTMESTARTVLEGVIKHIGVQNWYAGTAQSGADTKAAPGLLAQSNSATTHVVDADGSTALTSVYMARLGDGYCDHVYGNGTTLNMGEWMEETVESAAGKKLRALVSYVSGRIAPRLSNKNALVRVKKLGTDSGKGLTDALLFQAFEKFLTNGQEPNAIFMGPRSQRQLQASRTATTTNGAPAPLPTEWNGIPIYITNSISLAETV
jgi:HK97 family phage prohead protease